MESQQALSIYYPINNYLRPVYPKLEPFGNCTLQQLLSMTAHLESYDNLPQWETSYAANPMADVLATSLIEMVTPNSASPPWYYSNTGYLLAQVAGDMCAYKIGSVNLAAVIARVAHAAFLKNTHYTTHVYPPEIAAQVVAGYYANDEKGLQPLLHKDVTPYSLSWAQAAGSMVSTPEDLTVWARRLYQQRSVLPNQQMRELLEIRSCVTGLPVENATSADPKCFGLGISQLYDDQYPDRDRVFWFYMGETLGFRAIQVYWIGSDIALALCVNSRTVTALDETRALTRKLYDIIQSR
jgi:D-alanyl-D-alanine carboxypeptidase